jgi:signal transduction histidine kinase/ligand-binding sensor domain-containing protein
MRNSGTPRAKGSIRRRGFVLAAMLISCVDARAERLPLKTYSTSDGLAHNVVNRIVRDSRGFLWFCTKDGLSRFDGYAFATFGTDEGLPAAGINDLLETRRGDYWIATDLGLMHFDPTGTAAPGVVDIGAGPSAPMFGRVRIHGDDRSRAVFVLRETRDGTLWAGTNDGLYRVDQRHGHVTLEPVDIGIPHEFPEQRVVADLLEDRHGWLWIGAYSGLYRRWADGTTARYTERDGLPNAFVQDLLEDHQGELWAGTRLGGFFRFRADETHRAPVVDRHFTYHEDDPYGLPTSWVYQLFETSDRRFWIATARGLVEFFPDADERGRFHVYATKNGLTDFNITAVNEDIDANLWLATGTAGAMKLTRGGFTTFGKDEGVEAVNAVVEDQAGHLCFRGKPPGDSLTSIFERGRAELFKEEQARLYMRLGCFDGERLDWFKPASVTRYAWGWVQERVTLQSRTGEWWLGTGGGLYHFPRSDFSQLRTAKPIAVYTTKHGLAALQVFCLFEDSMRNIWVSSIDAARNGLARWDASSGTMQDLTHAAGLPPFKNDRPRTFAEDRAGTVWIGFNSGLARYAHGRFSFFSTNDGLPSGAVMDMHVDQAGCLWLASSRGGLTRVDNPGASRPTFTTYTTAQGLSSNATEVIAEDMNGLIYVGGGHGLDALDPKTGRVRHFTTDDGLGPGQFRAAYRDRNGVLWFGMTGGLARLSPAPAIPRAAAPVLIRAIRVRGVPRLLSVFGEHDLTLPAFAPDQNQVEIDFAGLSFKPGDVLRYQYRLDGVDDAWSAPADRRTVTYARLAPGSYRFMVRAANSDGLTSDSPAVVSFRILKPVWLRWWFVSFSAAAIGFAAFTGYRYRVARLLDIANMRTRIATDLHDDIGANLTRIALLSEVARRDQYQEDARNDRLASIASIARESVSSMSDIVWAINPARESLLDLTRRMRRYADEMYTLRGIQLRFSAPEATDHLKLGVDVRRDLLLIFKEAVNNSVRHARCSSVTIDLRVEGRTLRLAMHDDGRGFDTSAEREGQGLLSMERRARRLKGRLEIVSGTGNGTDLTLELPL